jgi:hypothetical protein
MALATLWLINIIAAPAVAQPPSSVSDQSTIMTRGPVHEAFAKPITFNPEPGIIVAKQPPPPITEQPPEYRPAGANIAWIPGYWAWADDAQNFLWISGLWRAVPPTRQWIPGYWAKVDNGWQWVPGFWLSALVHELTYLPVPPESLETGPQGDPPAPDQIWVPGHWVWNGTNYAWQPGHWLAFHSGWVWTPAEYVWTPNGCIFVDGYWDYSIRRRGVIFAPVVFNAGVYAQPGFYYTPSVVLAVDLLTDYLFCRPHYHHYYFGDYYAADYLRLGIYPWFAFHLSHYGYDPIYAYHSAYFARADPQWQTRIRQDYQVRREKESARPPATFAAMQQLQQRQSTNVNVQNFLVARPLSELATARPADKEAVRFEKLTKENRSQIAQHATAVHGLAEHRSQQEMNAAAKTPGRQPKEAPKIPKVTLPQTGTVTAPAKADEKTQAPPAKPKPPAQIQPDTKAKPPAVTRPRPEDRLEHPKAEPPAAKTPAKPLPKAAEPKPQAPPHVEPKALPKVEPKAAPPKAEPKAPPKVEPKAVPHPEERPKAPPHPEEKQKHPPT